MHDSPEVIRTLRARIAAVERTRAHNVPVVVPLGHTAIDAAIGGGTCSMSRSGNVWDNAAMESFFSSLKTERIARKTYQTRNQARADMFDHIECFYNPTRRHSTLGYLSPMDFEKQANVA